MTTTHVGGAKMYMYMVVEKYRLNDIRSEPAVYSVWPTFRQAVLYWRYLILEYRIYARFRKVPVVFSDPY